MGKAVSNILKKLVIFFIFLGLVCLFFGGIVGWKQYQQILAEEREKEFVSLTTRKGDILKGSLQPLKSGEFVLTNEGVQIYFKKGEILLTEPLNESEKEVLASQSAWRRLKEKSKNLFFFFSGRVSESDKYITPGN